MVVNSNEKQAKIYEIVAAFANQRTIMFERCFKILGDEWADLSTKQQVKKIQDLAHEHEFFYAGSFWKEVFKGSGRLEHVTNENLVRLINQVRWTPSVGQGTGRLKREPRRLSFSGYAARRLRSEVITFLT
jgi:hypothetical protein